MSELIAWARAFDKRVDAVKWIRERQDAVYRQVLREEKHDLCDEDANRFVWALFWGWMRRGAPLT